MEQIPSGTNPADELVERPSRLPSAKRLEAQRQRDNAQELFQKSKAVWEEAVRSGEAARRVFEARPVPGGSPVSQLIQAVQEQSDSCEASYRRLWDRALAAQEKSTDGFQRAADAMAAANTRADQELADAADVFAAAETALSTAMEELRKTQVIWTGLGPSPDVEPVPGNKSSTVTTLEGLSSVSRREPTEDMADVVATEGTVTAGPDQSEVVKSGIAAPVQEELAYTEAISATETLRQEIAKARKPASPADTPCPAEEVRQELETLKGLQRELSAISPIVMNNETIKTKGPTVEQLLTEIGLGTMSISDESGPADEPAPAPRDDESATPAVPATEGVPVDPDGSAVYSGRIYLMFDANLKQEVLEAVWDAIEESAEVGAIVDTRLVSQEEGVQMTLDLRASQLDISAVRARLPGSEFAPIAEDRLRVTWSVPG